MESSGAIKCTYCTTCKNDAIYFGTRTGQKGRTLRMTTRCANHMPGGDYYKEISQDEYKALEVMFKLCLSTIGTLNVVCSVFVTVVDRHAIFVIRTPTKKQEYSQHVKTTQKVFLLISFERFLEKNTRPCLSSKNKCEIRAPGRGQCSGQDKYYYDSKYRDFFVVCEGHTSFIRRGTNYSEVKKELLEEFKMSLRVIRE